MSIRDLATFCWSNRDFFDTPDRIDDAADRYADPAELPEGAWTRGSTGVWAALRPTGGELPEQGWKIHVSSTLDESVKVLDIVWRYCTERSIAFKYLRSEKALLIMNEKNCSRGSSGKFITIYPRDESELTATLTELGALLESFSGPYILGDLRHRNGPLYVRYGAFLPLWCTDAQGNRKPAFREPDGTLVPDLRRPVFETPSWVKLPPILGPDLEARQQNTGADFPYEIQSSLQFTNGGGLYLATDQRGTRVVVREARPHAGIDANGRDAVARLEASRHALSRLDGLSCVPRLIDYRVVGDHHYLVEEYIEGRTLLREIVTRHPLVEPGASDAEKSAYARWAEEVVGRVGVALAAIHERGMSFGDLHPSNIMVRPDETVVLVDFELAAELDDTSARALHTPGYSPPTEVVGAAADRFALERTLLTTLLPLTGLAGRDETKLSTLVEVATSALPVTAETRQRLRQGLLGSGSEPSADRAGRLFAETETHWDTIRADLIAAIGTSATPSRTDRLFPGDPAQFKTGGVDVATGAAGVLFALSRTGVAVDPEHLDWLASQAMSVPEPPVGLLTGLHGTALVLDHLGRRDQALAVLERVDGRDECGGAADLSGGQAGVAISLLDLANRTGDSALRDRALAIGRRLAGLVRGADPLGVTWTGRAGLISGGAGVAALFLRLYEDTGDPVHLDTAEAFLRRDLAHCAARSPGTLYVLDGTRNLPYLDNGSIGLAVMVARYLRHRDNAELGAAVAAARRACDTSFAFQSGVQAGRAGLILGLADIGDPADADLIRRHVRWLGWHAINHQGRIAFPGVQLQRLSMDLFTGTAGVLLAAHAAITGDGTFLPGLSAASPHPPRSVKEVNT